MCSHCTHTIKAAWTGVPTTLARNKRLFNLVSNNKELLEKLSTMAQRDIDNVVRTWQRDPELMMQVLQTMTGKPLLTADKNTDLLNKFKDNIGQAYRLGLDAAPGTPQLIPRMIEESVKDNVFKFVTRLDDDTRRELGTKLSDIIEHNRTAPQIEKLMPRDVATELSKVLDGNVARAEAIARTETMRSANLASWSQAKAMGATHYTVDSSFEACDECSETYDGEVYPIDDTDNLPPLHPNCACVPLFGSEEEMMADADELSQRNEEEVSDLVEMGMEPAPDGSGPVEITEDTTESVSEEPQEPTIDDYIPQEGQQFTEDFSDKRGDAKIEYGHAFNSQTGETISGEIKGGANTVKGLSVSNIDSYASQGADTIIHNHPDFKTLSAPSPSDFAVAVESKIQNSIVVSERGNYLIQTPEKSANPFYMELEMRGDSIKAQQSVVDDMKSGVLQLKDDKELMDVVNQRYEDLVFARAEKYGITVTKW